MDAKLDENLGSKGAQILRTAGWNVATVLSQDLCAAADDTIIEVCRAEGRILVSLDKDFSDTLRYSPQRYSGIVILRMPHPTSLASIERGMRTLVAAAAARSPVGRLWVIDGVRVREFQKTEQH